MVANVGKLVGKIAEHGYNNGTFAKEMGMSAITLRRKMYDEHYEFYIGESVRAKELLHLTDEEYLAIFIG